MTTKTENCPTCGAENRDEPERKECLYMAPAVNWRWVKDEFLNCTDYVVCSDPWHNVSSEASPTRKAALHDINPIGKLIIDHSKLQQWTDQGYAQQRTTGLWLHYTAICELLHSSLTAAIGQRDILAENCAEKSNESAKFALRTAAAESALATLQQSELKMRGELEHIKAEARCHETNTSQKGMYERLVKIRFFANRALASSATGEPATPKEKLAASIPNFRCDLCGALVAESWRKQHIHEYHTKSAPKP